MDALDQEQAAYERAKLRLFDAHRRWQAAQHELDAAMRELEEATRAEFNAAKSLLENGGSL